MMNEIDRIKEVYAKRQSSGKNSLYSPFNPASLFESHLREKALLHDLKRYGFNDLSEANILDIGCGTGSLLRDFIRYGASPENLYGIDLLQERIDIARRLSPQIHLDVGDASKLSYTDESFLIVMQYVVFSSILEAKMRRDIAREMMRVLRPDGVIIWLDFHMNNPRNRDVTGIKKKDIYNLFPHCSIHLTRLNLAPPLIRAIIPHSWFTCYWLERLKIFNTHYLGIIRKKSPE